MRRRSRPAPRFRPRPRPRPRPINNNKSQREGVLNCEPTASGEAPGSQYALQVAIQTMKGRYEAFEKRLAASEADNRRLRGLLAKYDISADKREKKVQITTNVEKATVEDESVHRERLKERIPELIREKTKLLTHTCMVTAENHQLWKKLSQMSDTQNSATYPIQDLGIQYMLLLYGKIIGPCEDVDHILYQLNNVKELLSHQRTTMNFLLEKHEKNDQQKPVTLCPECEERVRIEEERVADNTALAEKFKDGQICTVCYKLYPEIVPFEEFLEHVRGHFEKIKLYPGCVEKSIQNKK